MLTLVNLCKRIRVHVIAMLAMTLLFGQMAVAAYVCPATSSQTAVTVLDMAGMPCAERMADGAPLDPEQPALCMQHCQFGATSQVVDHLPTVFVPATAFGPTLRVEVDEGRQAGLRSWAEAERLRDRPPPLAHSIAHCCFRI